MSIASGMSIGWVTSCAGQDLKDCADWRHSGLSLVRRVWQAGLAGPRFRAEMSHTTLTVQVVSELPRHHEITIQVATEATISPTQPHSQSRLAGLQQS